MKYIYLSLSYLAYTSLQLVSDLLELLDRARVQAMPQKLPEIYKIQGLGRHLSSEMLDE